MNARKFFREGLVRTAGLNSLGTARSEHSTLLLFLEVPFDDQRTSHLDALAQIVYVEPRVFEAFEEEPEGAPKSLGKHSRSISSAALPRLEVCANQFVST